MILTVPFVFLRHGETDWNRERRVQGHSDIPLNAAGIAQAEAVAPVLVGLGLRTVCCSPMARARRTAEIVNRTLGLPLVVIDALREVSFGPHEGETRPAWFPDWLKGITPPGAEPFDEFVPRAVGAVNKALAQPGPVLIVSHGGIHRALQYAVPMNTAGIAGNCHPLQHDPPTEEAPNWRVTPLACGV